MPLARIDLAEGKSAEYRRTRGQHGRHAAFISTLFDQPRESRTNRHNVCARSACTVIPAQHSPSATSQPGALRF